MGSRRGSIRESFEGLGGTRGDLEGSLGVLGASIRSFWGAPGALGSPRGALGGGQMRQTHIFARVLRVPGGGDGSNTGVKSNRDEASGGEGGELSILSRAKY